MRDVFTMITGSTLRDAIISGANNIASHKQEVDSLNVFPVPDGDTGTNMSMTMGAAARELTRMPATATVAEVASTAASALLRGARGNSGVILSLLFRGFSKGLAGQKTADGRALAHALGIGVEAAYKAVMKPTEGTILTVARVSAEQGRTAAETDDEVTAVWQAILDQAEQTLAETPEMLPVLKKAGVVDAGGRGLIVIFEGMMSVFAGKGICTGDVPLSVASTPSPSEFTFEDDHENITFGYCTEYIVNRQNDKDPLALRAYLESIGDCVVVVDDEEIIKVHVHTDNPGFAIQEGLKFGALSNMKIDNMRLQHQALVVEAKEGGEDPVQKNYVPVDESIDCGFVAVSAGEGIESLFLDLGVNVVVKGGQTMNPSTEDILAAIESVPARTVFVLPNNKNIIMAAEQTVHLADRQVFVLPTRTIPQGLSAMLAYDPELSCEDNFMGMQKAAERVQSGSVTFAARDSHFDGHNIKAGEILALEGSKLLFTDRDLEHAVVKLVSRLSRKDTSFVTLIQGQDVSDEDAGRICQAVEQKLDRGIEVNLVNGGQPVYYFLISIE